MVRRRKTDVISEEPDIEDNIQETGLKESNAETPEFLKAYLRDQAERESALKAKEADAANKEAEKIAAVESQQVEVCFIFIRIVIPGDIFSAPRAWLNHRLDELQILGVLPQNVRPTL